MYTINFVNNNSDIATPWVTFVQATQVVNKTTELVGPVFAAVDGNGTALKNGASYSLADINNTISMGPTDWQGHLYISDSALTLPTSGGLPVDAAYTVTTDTARYQMLEFAGSSTQANTDITYINWYSIPLQMESTTSQTSGGNARGVPKSQTVLSAMLTTLTGLSGNNPMTVVTNSANQIVRVISPNAGNPSWLPLYASFKDYLDKVFSVPTATILLQNTYDGIGNPPSPDFQPQEYQSSSVTYDGTTLTIQGTTPILKDFTMTSAMDADTFNSVLYLAVMSYAWSYGTTSNSSGNTGDNNVFSAISRDLMAGFAYGFIGSEQFGSQPSSAWMGASDTEVFSDIQPNNPYYNPWANAINDCFSDVYTFPFNDFLTGYAPELTTNDGDTLTITLPNP
jgi:Beta-1,3-glucanase